MKVVINITWGGFELPLELREIITDDYWGENFDTRTNPTLIEYVEGGNDRNLAVAIIPDNATDWEILEHDGKEQIICVVDGKLYHARTLGKGA